MLALFVRLPVVYAAEPPFTACVDVLRIYQFYYKPEGFLEEAADEIRRILTRDYPELTPLRCCLRPEAAQRHNEAMLRRLRDAAGQIDRSQAVSVETAQKIIDEVAKDPLTAPENVEKYETDPSRKMGLCFGRACGVHWNAVSNHGVPETAVRRIFLMGNFRTSDRQTWTSHTAVLVRADNPEGWLVLDPIVGKPVTPSRWKEIWTKERATEEDDAAVMFVASANQIVIDPNTSLGKILAHPHAGPFFRDLMRRYPNYRPPQ